MTLMDKVRDLLRGSVNDSLESLTEANCARIYRQEIREAEDMLSRRRDALGALVALQETRSAICGGVENFQRLEDAVEEAQERVGTSAVERSLRSMQKDPESLRVAAVLERLQKSVNPGNRNTGGDHATA